MDAAFYRKLLDSMFDGVYFVDRERVITYWNQGAERISGYAADEVVGRSCADNLLRHVDVSGCELCVEGCPLSATMQDGKVREAEVFMHHRNGHRVPVRVRGAPLVDESGAVVGAVEVFSENTRNYKAFRTLRRLQSEVLRDALTGIGNRKLADMTLDNLLHGFHTHGVPFGVLLADIDHFKRVNDTWGHGVGDRVLRMVAGTLTSGVRPLDTACRWGGEEFLVLLPGAGEQGLANAAERLRVMIASSWVVEQGERMIVTASFGGTVSRPGDTARTVLDRADATLYRSKQAGRNCTSLDCAQSEQGGGQPI